MENYNINFHDVVHMNFPQPTIQVGQAWFEVSTTNRVVITDTGASADEYLSRVYFTPLNDIGTTDLTIDNFLNKFIYCPTVEDILGQLPNYNLSCYILNGKRKFELKPSKTVMIDGSSFPKGYSQPTAIGVCVEVYLSIKQSIKM